LTDPWVIIGPILAGSNALTGTIVGFLIREHEKDSRAVAAMTEKMITQAIPALERSTASGQALLPILERNATALGGATEAASQIVEATGRLLTELAVQADRNRRR
jgi:hypothetical protein